MSNIAVAADVQTVATNDDLIHEPDRQIPQDVVTAIFASPEPVIREVLARAVEQDDEDLDEEVVTDEGGELSCRQPTGAIFGPIGPTIRIVDDVLSEAAA